MDYNLFVGEHETEKIIWFPFLHILIHLAYADTNLI